MTELNEKGLEAARTAWMESASDYTRLSDAIEAAIRAYLAASQPQEGEAEQLREFEQAGYARGVAIGLAHPPTDTPHPEDESENETMTPREQRLFDAEARAQSAEARLAEAVEALNDCESSRKKSEKREREIREEAVDILRIATQKLEEYAWRGRPPESTNYPSHVALRSKVDRAIALIKGDEK